MKKFMKKMLLNYKQMRYNSVLNNDDLKLYKQMEKEYGFHLDGKTKKMIDDYAREVFGSKAFAPSLYVYTIYNRKFKEGWIPDNFFGFVVAPIVNKGLGKLANMKTMTKKILQTEKLPDKFYVIDEILYDENYSVVKKEAIKKVLFDISDSYFLKYDHSNQGKGVYKLTKDNFHLDRLLSQGDAVLQLPIKQAGFFNEILEDNVATIRILTVKDTLGNIRIAGSFLRVGRKEENIVRAETSIKIPIIDRHGTLNEFGNADAGWKKFYEHPDTGFIFKNEKIPYYSKVLDTCLELHKKLPNVTIIAWDLSVNNNNKVEIIEWNANHPGIKFLEAAQGPMFKDLGWEKLKVN